MDRRRNTIKQEWEEFKSVAGCLLSGIYANKLDTHQFGKDLILHSDEPVLEIKDSVFSNPAYWKVEWAEDETGDDILQIQKQKTPAPVKYEPMDSPVQEFVVMGSSFTFEKNLIKKVSGYGFKDGQKENLSNIVLEMEELYISIETGPVIRMTISSRKAGDLESLIFST
ncbi:hypothetical protein [Sediminibacillus massiliensis]|uniref:hypothetical protein n=1 Tax=Sediminibacillus massiliensis TaxID=1926277 RepID=UPI000988363B|nr:hypothetical protein [Sediminibacillus massiliensis]